MTIQIKILIICITLLCIIKPGFILTYSDLLNLDISQANSYISSHISIDSKQQSNSNNSINYSRSLQSIKNDTQEFYSKNTFNFLVIGYLAGSVIANSNLDQSFQNFMQDKLRNESSDRIAAFVKPWGNGKYAIPFLIGVYYVFSNSSKINQWSRLSMRAMLVGAPTMLIGQSLTGASRPQETDYRSKWRPLKDDNGVSGHAFMGAIPFFTAAKFFDNEPVIRSLFYGGALLVGWSRINDNKHYLSQVFLGVLHAFLSVEAVCRNNDSAILSSNQSQIGGIQNYYPNSKKSFVVSPLILTSMTGLVVNYNF